MAILEAMKPGRYVWCQHGQTPGMKNDEHQVCIDQEAAHYARGYSTWGCTCKCHK
jgi:hypothetical protein